MICSQENLTGDVISQCDIVLLAQRLGGDGHVCCVQWISGFQPPALS